MSLPSSWGAGFSLPPDFPENRTLGGDHPVLRPEPSCSDAQQMDRLDEDDHGLLRPLAEGPTGVARRSFFESLR